MNGCILGCPKLEPVVLVLPDNAMLALFIAVLGTAVLYFIVESLFELPDIELFASVRLFAIAFLHFNVALASLPPNAC